MATANASISYDFGDVSCKLDSIIATIDLWYDSLEDEIGEAKGDACASKWIVDRIQEEYFPAFSLVLTALFELRRNVNAASGQKRC